MVIDGLPSENSRRAYQRHLEEFFVWHQNQNRPEMNKTLINRYVKELRKQKLSSTNIYQKLSVIRKLASEAEDNNLLDSRIANGIRAVKGMRWFNKSGQETVFDGISKRCGKNTTMNLSVTP